MTKSIAIKGRSKRRRRRRRRGRRRRRRWRRRRKMRYMLSITQRSLGGRKTKRRANASIAVCLTCRWCIQVVQSGVRIAYAKAGG